MGAGTQRGPLAGAAGSVCLAFALRVACAGEGTRHQRLLGWILKAMEIKTGLSSPFLKLGCVLAS